MNKWKMVWGAFFAVFALNSALADPAPARKSGAMNPDISLNALMLYRNSSRGNHITDKERNGPSIQESELQFAADVDPYSKLNAIFAVHQEAPSGGREGEWKIEPEELYVDATEIPAVSVRAGKFKAALGKHNSLHTHAFPFIDAPLINSVLVGEEGFNDVGLSGAWLVPLPWFMELTGQVFSGRPQKDGAESAYFNNGSANSSVYVTHLRNLVDFCESTTGELGLSASQGSNEFADENGVNQAGLTTFWGADLTFKWRPVEGGKSRAAIWSTEYLNRRINRPLSRHQADGFATWLQFQFSERWWVQARGDYLQAEDNAPVAPLEMPSFQRRYTALIGFFPSEFSGVRLQYSQNVDGKPDSDPEKKVLLQFNFTIGAHPAHAY